VYGWGKERSKLSALTQRTDAVMDADADSGGDIRSEELMGALTRADGDCVGSYETTPHTL
jgi:hypothetical protein